MANLVHHLPLTGVAALHIPAFTLSISYLVKHKVNKQRCVIAPPAQGKSDHHSCLVMATPKFAQLDATTVWSACIKAASKQAKLRHYWTQSMPVLCSARQWLRAARQGQFAPAPVQGTTQQASARRVSRQGSGSKAGQQVQRQHQAAQEAEQRLVAFQEAAQRSRAELVKDQQLSTVARNTASAARPVPPQVSTCPDVAIGHCHPPWCCHLPRRPACTCSFCSSATMCRATACFASMRL